MRKIGNYGNVKLQKEQFQVLVNLLKEAKNCNETEAILKTVLTQSERAIIAQRLAIIRMIFKKFKYSDIEIQLHVSTNTISNAMNAYVKNGTWNSTFNQQLARFRFEPKIDVLPPGTGGPEYPENAAGVHVTSI